ncbi:MAG: hypothetical protein CMM15_07420 [Rhodospirillaceae bacterium]|nr:hypothetical protein [Rhodospirillaceae bacterium]|tara:strand:+ start:393 stop:764 length:372 start_codon:yes stop_codon:yes gene_type:complete
MKTFSCFGFISVSVIFVGTIIAVSIILSTSKSQKNDSFAMETSVAKKLQTDDTTCAEFTDSDDITCSTHCANAGGYYHHCLQNSDGNFINCFEDDNQVYCECSTSECDSNNLGNTLAFHTEKV